MLLMYPIIITEYSALTFLTIRKLSRRHRNERFRIGPVVCSDLGLGRVYQRVAVLPVILKVKDVGFSFVNLKVE